MNYVALLWVEVGHPYFTSLVWSHKSQIFYLISFELKHLIETRNVDNNNNGLSGWNFTFLCWLYVHNRMADKKLK